jgi:hypothetical protein
MPYPCRGGEKYVQENIMRCLASDEPALVIDTRLAHSREVGCFDINSMQSVDDVGGVDVIAVSVSATIQYCMQSCTPNSPTDKVLSEV